MATTASIYPTSEASPARAYGYAYEVRVTVDGLYCGVGRFCEDAGAAREWCAREGYADVVEHDAPHVW